MSLYLSLAQLPDDITETWKAAEHLPFESSYNWYSALNHTTFKSSAAVYVIPEEERSQVLPCTLTKKNFLWFNLITQLNSMSNYYPSLYQPVQLEKQAPSLLHLFNSIQLQLKVDCIHLKPLSDEDTQQIKSMLYRNNFHLFTYFKFGNWFLKVAGKTYEQYFETLPSKLRNTILRKEKKLKKEQEYKVSIHTSLLDISKAIFDYEKVYNSSWKRTEPYPGFIRKISIDGAKKNETRLGIIYIGNKPIAAQLWFVKNKKASIFKLAYDPEFSNYSIGSILSSKLFKHVIDTDKVTVIDYLTGDDPYKKDWMSHRRKRFGLIAYNNKTFIGKFLYCSYRARQLLKKIVAVFLSKSRK